MHKCTLIFLEIPRPCTPVLQCSQGFSAIWNLNVPFLAQLRCCFGTNPKDEVLCLCLPRAKHSMAHFSFVLSPNKALCVPARPSCMGIPDKRSFNTEPAWSLVIDRATAMTHLPKMLFWSPLKAKRKGLQGIFDSGVQVFWVHTLPGNVKDHSPGLEEDSTFVCRWNKTVAYLKSRKWGWISFTDFCGFTMKPVAPPWVKCQPKQSQSGFLVAESTAGSRHLDGCNHPKFPSLPLHPANAWSDMKQDFSCRLLHVLHEHLYRHPSRICPKSENRQNSFSAPLFTIWNANSSSLWICWTITKCWALGSWVSSQENH